MSTRIKAETDLPRRCGGIGGRALLALAIAVTAVPLKVPRGACRLPHRRALHRLRKRIPPQLRGLGSSLEVSGLAWASLSTTFVVGFTPQPGRHGQCEEGRR